jgi:hypothetical protein
VQELDAHLETWTEHGIISAEQAERIATFEGSAGAPDEPPPSRPRTSSRRAAIAEAVGYLGAVLALSAVALIVGDLWPQLEVGGRLTLVGLLTVVAAGAGEALHRQSAPAVRRLTGVLWAAAAVGAAWFAGLVADEVIGMDPAAITLTVGVVGTVVAAPLLLRRPGLPLHLATLGALMVALIGALDLSALPVEVFYEGLAVAAIGGAWVLLGRGGWLTPTRTTEVVGGVVGLAGLQTASFGDLRGLALTLGLLVAGSLIALAVQRDAQHMLVVGAVGAFVLLPQLVVEVFGDQIGAPATLLVVGLLLVLMAVGLGRARREVRPDPPSANDRGGAR